MRRMLFALTARAMRERRKTVTRRRADTWTKLAAGDRLLAVDMHGGRLGVIEVVDVRVEPLDAISEADCYAEGVRRKVAGLFGLAVEGMSPDSFVATYRRLHGGEPDQPVRRIEFRHVDAEAS